jgi:hypothetical protein
MEADMGLQIKPSDLYFRYRRNKQRSDQPKFCGKPDQRPYDRDDLYEVIPMFEAVMDELNSRDANVLHRLEKLAGDEMPRFIRCREEVFDFLVSVMRDMLGVESGQRSKSGSKAGPESGCGEANHA